MGHTTLPAALLRVGHTSDILLNFLQDNCASGGTRHDLETMSRSIALWPSDYSATVLSEDWPSYGGVMQSMTMGLSRWLPVHGGAFLDVTPYEWRSVGIGTKNCDWGYVSAHITIYSPRA